MKKKTIKILFVIFASTALSVFLIATLIKYCITSCDYGKFVKHFDDYCVTNDDGFRYYYNKESNDGAYILTVPNVENLVIPEFIDGKKVLQLGHCDTGIGYMNEYFVIGTNTKTLTVNHQLDFYRKSSDYYVDFPNLTKLIFTDFLYCNLTTSEQEITVPYYVGKPNANITTVELRKSDRTFSLENFAPKVIVIPDYVRIIEQGVFAGLKNVTIKTSYASQPEGWEIGWNGSCEVMWGSARE